MYIIVVMKKVPSVLPNDSTPIVPHVHYQPEMANCEHTDLYDFNEFKIRKLIESEHGKKKILYETLYNDYVNGKIFIGWKDGEMLYYRKNLSYIKRYERS